MLKILFLTSIIAIAAMISPTAMATGVYGQSQSEIQQMQQQQQIQQQQQGQQPQSSSSLFSQSPQLQQQQQLQQIDPNSIGQGSTQPNRVGIHDNAQQTSGEGSNPGGTVTDPTLAQFFPGGVVSANCFGKVIQDRAQEHLENPDEGTLGDHVSDPVPEIPGREVPRQGIGNQDQGHPAAHGAFNSQFDADDLANAQASC